jgi:UPF0755 protein
MRVRLILVLLLVVLAAAGGWFAFNLLTPYRNFDAAGVFVEIPRGTPLRAAARTLVETGVVRNALAFELYARWRGEPLQAGEYFFDQPASARDVFRKLADGRVYFHTLAIPEGLNIFEIAGRVEKAGLSNREEFLAVARDPSLIRDLAPAARSLEGFLFPATYAFPRSATAREIASAMVSRFREVWASLPQAAGPAQALSAAQVVALASLVETETGVADERPLIAAVFHNRLRKGIALQCDPTVLYAMELAGKNDGIIHLSDLRMDSPYNTYRHRGLPPGPIANPGKAALLAALQPPQADYLFFVSNTQGGHFFSRTLSEHNARVAEYRRLAGLPPKAPEPQKPPAKRSPKRRNR